MMHRGFGNAPQTRKARKSFPTCGLCHLLLSCNMPAIVENRWIVPQALEDMHVIKVCLMSYSYPGILPRDQCSTCMDAGMRATLPCDVGRLEVLYYFCQLRCISAWHLFPYLKWHILKNCENFGGSKMAKFTPLTFMWQAVSGNWRCAPSLSHKPGSYGTFG